MTSFAKSGRLLVCCPVVGAGLPEMRLSGVRSAVYRSALVMLMIACCASPLFEMSRFCWFAGVAAIA
jgi:hypothetical protein